MYNVVSMGTVGKAAPTRAQWPDLLPTPVCLSFVMVNSVAMEGDGCSICSEAEAELREISRKLNCSREVQGSSQCEGEQRLPFSAPVLLQHYPLYRASDANCSGEDAAPPEEKNVPFKEKYDVLSQEASQKVCVCVWCCDRMPVSHGDSSMNTQGPCAN
ncbi:metallophosphoesterase 1-like isoform X2 [Alexandromys fortis]|uniref:metallophosphoesterase 1-like isoform X2 n=2 Tax=Alexandromys fortis TaxID=100897 RepID=UPI0021526657|nr:metallophosphoesterase 1-like isoform X2 [Microtus fortis]